ncbi:uncharacterized protein LOC143303096, partial [Bombus vancouverensis nearcticus]|uniref:uncharacterized protein LOC143303096 n=1 Tax=Bombus vancouverensis nearcticus TaxID=2705178 RepID=UPI00402B0E20
MANVGDERLSGEEGSTLEELRNKLARMNLPISGARSVLIARLNRACRAGQSYRKGSTGGEELTGQRDLENVQRAERDCNEDEDVEKMNTKELKERLASLGLKTTGRKVELRARLRAAMDGNDISSEEESDDESEDEDGKKNAREYKRDTRRVYQDRDECCRRACVGSTLSFRDVEDALESFSGNRGENVERWFESFEEVADTCMWSDGQKAVYARKLLKGSAKIFASFECHARTWHELKRGLVKEFSRKVNSRQVHQKLEEIKKESDEACLAYMYRMLEIASHVDMEEEAKVEYIVDGIIDDENNKAVLYGATSIKGLRKRLVMYEEQKSRRAKSIVKPAKTQKNGGRPRQSVDAMKKRRCSICGSEDHLRVKCPEKGKGMKCFKCNRLGHVAANCTARQVKTYVISRPERKKYVKDVSIDGCRFVSLVDTGSDLTFIRADEYVRLGSPPLGNCKLKFDGFGSAGNSTWGEFTRVMTVDGCDFTVTLHVVSDKVMTRHSLLLGTDFLDQVELRVKRGEVTFLRLDDQTDGHEDAPDVLRVNAIEQSDEIDLSHVRESHYREAIRDIIKGYRPEKKRDAGITAKIVLKSDKPVARRPRRLAPSERKEVDDLMEAWINEGVIKPSDSEYASPIVVVRKKDGSIRVCVDFRELNELIECPHFPLPLIEDVLDALQGAQLFTTIDLKNGFFHVSLDKDSQRYTSFVTPTGQYEFLKLPFGLKISPIVFQKYISKIYKELMDKGIVIVYMDDIIVLAKNLEEAWERLQMVVELTGQYGLVINWKKCRFMQREIEYLGHIVSGNTIKPSAHKTKAVANFPKPTSVRKVQSFLGLTGYFRKFIRGYAKIAKPLTDLLKKEIDFKFGDRESEAFETLKAALTSGPVLTLYRIGAETELHTDASAEGYGAILMQLDLNDGKFHPVYFASGKTTPTEARYTSYELEVLAI